MQYNCSLRLPLMKHLLLDNALVNHKDISVWVSLPISVWRNGFALSFISYRCQNYCVSSCLCLLWFYYMMIPAVFSQVCNKATKKKNSKHIVVSIVTAVTVDHIWCVNVYFCPSSLVDIDVVHEYLDFICWYPITKNNEWKWILQLN